VLSLEWEKAVGKGSTLHWTLPRKKGISLKMESLGGVVEEMRAYVG